jgi:hypothetical protein
MIVIIVIIITWKYYMGEMRMSEYTIENILLFAIKFLRKQ